MTRLKEIRANRYYKKAQKRLETQSAAVVGEWGMTSLWATQRALETYQRTGDPASLEEARLGSLALLASLDNLLDRKS